MDSVGAPVGGGGSAGTVAVQTSPQGAGAKPADKKPKAPAFDDSDAFGVLAMGDELVPRRPPPRPTTTATASHGTVRDVGAYLHSVCAFSFIHARAPVHNKICGMPQRLCSHA